MMASNTGFRTSLTLADCMEMTRKAFFAWLDDRAPSMGAALAYYTLFSMAPLLLIAVSVAGLVFGPDAARGEIFGQMRALVGADGAAAIQALLESVNRPAGGILGTLLGLAVMLVGATTVFAELQDALDRIWRAPTRPPGGLISVLRARVLSFGMILGLGFLLMVSMLFSAAVGALQAWWAPWLGGWDRALTVLNATSGFILVTVMFAMIYKAMPRVQIAWTDVWVGAIVTAGLFSLGRALIGAYLASGALGSGFGAAGALVVVLVWVYYSAQIFLLGAEFTWVYAHQLGSRRDLVTPSAASSYSTNPQPPMEAGSNAPHRDDMPVKPLQTVTPEQLKEVET